MNCPLIEVSDEMLDAVERLLEDSTEHVRVPAAVVLHCTDRHCEIVHNYYAKLHVVYNIASYKGSPYVSK